MFAVFTLKRILSKAESRVEPVQMQLRAGAPRRLAKFTALLVATAITAALAQSGPAGSQTTSNATAQQPAAVPELTTHEELETFQVKVSLVEVRVVVRDAKGNAVGNLKQDDFLIFDDNKPQTIKSFVVEKRETPGIPLTATQADGGGKAQAGFVTPNRVALFFDDFYSTAMDLMGARNAAEQRVNRMKPGESIAIFTASGQGTQDFTDNPEALQAALRQLKPRPIGGGATSECPPIDYYVASQIYTHYDSRALQMVMSQVTACMGDGNTAIPSGSIEAMARSAAMRVLQAGDTQTQVLLSSLGDVMRRMSSLSGQRTLVFLSPGFVVAANQAALTDYMNRAIQAGVIISTVDVKGLYTTNPIGVDVSQKAWGSAYVSADMASYQNASNLSQAEPLIQIAEATGGSYFHNRNDLAEGLDKLTAPPAFSYLIGFAPQNLKNDGTFHSLKVKLKDGNGLTVQARKGYNSPKAGDSNQEAQREIADEVFAQNEIRELPMRVQTQFYRSGEDKVHIEVIVKVDVQHMAFKKAEGRNLNDLTVVAALFDRNANFITAKSKTVQMHIKDDTLAKMTNGISVRSNFDVGAGNYVVRVVARDAQGKLAAQNDVLDIP